VIAGALLTLADYEALCGLADVRSAGPALVAAPGEWAVAGPVADLERLARLFDAGHLTAEEFRAAKAAVLENR